MSTYTAILSVETDPGKPVKSDLAKRWSDNWIGGFAGAAGAPRLQGRGIMRFSEYPILTVTAAAAFSLQVNGTAVVLGTVNTTSTVDVDAHTVTPIKYTGGARFNASHLTNNAAATSTLSLFKNNVLVIAFTTTSTTAVARTVDVNFVSGDVIEWRHKISVNTTSSVVSLFSTTASNNYTTVPTTIAGLDL